MQTEHSLQSKYILIISWCMVAATLWAIFFQQALLANALQAGNNIAYPVADLGNCANESDCKTYCNKAEHRLACLDFAEEKGLMTPEEITVARKFVKGEVQGPGGCTDREACQEYCNDMARIDECVAFVEKENLISAQELQEYKQVQAAIKKGVKPPPCKNKEDCEQYCRQPGHMQECIAFGKEAGFLRGRELEDAEKMLKAIQKGIKPPACGGKEACEQYCSEPDHMEECIAFASEAGFMPPEELENAQKMLSAIKRGVKPLACRGKEACDAYCSQESHIEECVAFATEAGFMSQADAEMARKTGGRGPGGCRGREECEAFCNNPDNQETCFNFAKENGMMREEDQRMMEEGREKMMQGLQNAPPQVLACLEGKVGREKAEEIRSGGMPTTQMGEILRECFEQMRPAGVPNQGGMPPSPMDRNCQTPEECEQLKLRMMEGRPEGVPRDGNYPVPFPDAQPEEYQKQYEEQYRQQYQEQYQQQYDQQRLQMEQQYQQQYQQQYPQPEQLQEQPLPSAPQEPAPAQEPTSSTRSRNSFLGSLVSMIFRFLLNK